MAEKKPAQKAVEKKSTRKTAAKKVPKKTAKKTAAKKTTTKKSPVKRVVKKTAQKTTNKRGKEPAATEPIKSPYSEAIPEKDTYPQDVVSVPRTASPRLKERAALLHFIADRDVDAFIIRMSKVMGVLCLMFGLITSSSALFAKEMIWPGGQQSALTVLTKQSELTESITTTSTSGDLLNLTAADIDIVFDIDSVLSGEHELRIETSHGSRVDAYLKSSQNGTFHQFDMYDADVENKEWRYKINVTQLPEGTYQVKAKVTVSALNQVFELYGPEVRVEHPADNSGTSNTSEPEKSTTTDAIDDTANKTVDGVLDPVVSFVDLDDVIDGTERITIKAVYADTVKLILRDKERSMAVALTQTSSDPLTDTYIFKLDSIKYPNGTYDLLVRTTVDGTAYPFESDWFEIKNQVVEDVVTEIESESEEVKETETDAKTESIEQTVAEIKPAVRIAYDDARSTERYRLFKIEAKDAKFVEVYAKAVVGTTPMFLGLATRIDTNQFTYSIDTTKLPNGRYLITARAPLAGVLTTSLPLEIKVENFVQSTTAVQKTTTTNTTEAKQITADPTVTRVVEEVTNEELEKVESDTTNTLRTSTDSTESRQYTDDLLARFKTDIEAALQRYTSALRSGDQEAIERTRFELNRLKEKMILSIIDDVTATSYIESIEDRIAGYIAKLIQQTEITERIIKERTNDLITKDSDGDGITDYDEINLYGTDPAVADSDGDGFIDGAEILSGFNPNDAAYEAIIEYESPQQSGVVREDILLVESVRTIQEAESDAVDEKLAKAEIRGKALPNSFVTLYIFSTPVIVTVKTGDDGSWSYTFDKELEDGSHEVYVGITDNTGRIVAKSNPFQFVKEAQAFTPVDAAVGGTVTPTTPERPLSSPFTTPLILGLTLLVIGLMLIMLGRYLDQFRRNDEETVMPTPA